MIDVDDFRKKQILFVIPMEGDKLSFSNDNVVVKDKDGGIKHQSTCYRLFMICIVGGITITSGLIQRAKKFGFSICFMTQSLKVYEVIGARLEGNTLLRKGQYTYDEINMGRYIIQNKIKNQKAALIKQRSKLEYVKEGISLLDKYIAEVSNKQSIMEIMGVEGNASKVYFARHFNNVQWNGRQPRIKRDYVNALMDIGYTILFNFIDSVLSVYGFDVYYGIFHRSFYMRKSLVCDMVEPFRVIVDYQIKKSINLGQFREEDFEIYNGKWSLKWKCNGKYVSIFMGTILEYKEDIFKYIQSYYRAFMKMKPIDEFPVFEYK